MSNRIVFIQGSPRKNGNTRAITAIAMASAKEHGAEVAEIDVTKLSFKEPLALKKAEEFGRSLASA